MTNMKIAWKVCRWLVLSTILAAVPMCSAQSIHEFKRDSLKKIVAAQKGHPFVLAIWSLDCEYCRASLATLSNAKRIDRKLRVITLSTDSLADARSVSQMKATLAALGLGKNAWAFGDAPPEQLRYAIDVAWHGEMPRSYWFNPSGVSVALSGSVTMEHVDKLLLAR